ncbi:MAG: HAMP domain-containing histidine kinase, partial [Clostridiales bacterium]|nr:HAMP domain-containing histidine kinase [Clostridiales bacterium]
SLQEGVRRIEFSSAEGGFPYAETVQFRLWTMQNGEGYLITLQAGLFFAIFWRLMLVMLVFQLIDLIAKTSANARFVRRTLQPIEQLAQAARSLNREGALEIGELKSIAGKLDSINAARLGTRIDVAGAQDELKTLASAINSMLDRINEAYRAQTRFVSDASHELRTPISVIQGYAGLLDRWGKNDEKTLQESIDAIKSEAAGMKDMVEQLLFLARGDVGSMLVKMEPLDLAALAQETLRETRMIHEGHEFTARLIPALTCGDEGLVKQALRILIENAVKYTPTGGRVSVSVAREGAVVRLEVQDDGIGIPAEAVPHIFERFYRADQSRARATGGTGLGLSIAKWIVDRHGGHMEVLSREDIGTRVSIVLPAAQEVSEAT